MEAFRAMTTLPVLYRSGHVRQCETRILKPTAIDIEHMGTICCIAADLGSPNGAGSLYVMIRRNFVSAAPCASPAVNKYKHSHNLKVPVSDLARSLQEPHISEY